MPALLMTVGLYLALLQRIDMEGIFGHPWFQRDLPEGALAMNGSYMQSAPNLDQVRGCVVVMGRLACCRPLGPATHVLGWMLPHFRMPNFSVSWSCKHSSKSNTQHKHARGARFATSHPNPHYYPAARPSSCPSQCVPLVGQLIEAATIEGSPMDASLSLKLDGTQPAVLVVAAPPRVSPTPSRTSAQPMGTSPTPSRTSPPPAH